MESNWRFTVADLGWSHGPYALCSRVVGVPIGLWIAKRTVYDGTYAVLAFAVATGMTAEVGSGTIPAAHPHFPFGTNVFPD